MDHPINYLQGTYDMSIVALSYIIAVVTSFLLFDLAGRVSVAKSKRSRMQWLIGSAFFMIFGIWTIHFVGMLGYQLSIPVTYNLGGVVLSIVVTFCVSLFALYIIYRNQLALKNLFIGGAVMAIGIAAMHYLGLKSMSVQMYYEPEQFALSFVFAYIASVIALSPLFQLHKKRNLWRGLLYKIGNGLVIGVAIAGMNYMGIAGARLNAGPIMAILNVELEQEIQAYIIAFGALIILSFVLIAIFLDKRLTSKEDQMIDHENWYQSLYDNHRDGIITIDMNRNVVDVNPSAHRILGIDLSSHINQPASILLELHSEQFREETKRLFALTLLEGEVQTMETEIIHSQGHLVQLSSLSIPVIVDGVVKGAYLIFRDISDEKRSKEKIQKMAYHDELTGLPNRRLLKITLEDMIRESSQVGAQFALLYMDIDRFKIINDSLGHAYGDQFLLMLSERLHRAVEGMEVTIARMGGDEFTLICRADSIKEISAEIACKLIEIIQIPYRLKENEFYISASIGIAIYPEHGEDAEQLIKNADKAMYEVKRNGKNGYQFYSRQLGDQMLTKVELESALRKAIKNNELLIHYQPQINQRTKKIIGIEALLRWNHSEKGIIAPGIFIPIAEETGLIDEIGAWVLREACLQMKHWEQRYNWNIPVSVNLSTQQFHQKHLVKDIENILIETGLSPEFLELEITESMMMDAERSRQILHDLSGLGIRLSMDDFGTGYSSLSYLKLFPIHKLKIDRSFIKDITNNDDDRAIVTTIIAMAHNLKMNVIAEGVETKEQIEFLIERGCEEIQGYYFSKPIPASEIERLYILPIEN